jgi:glycosyltransferase A (GT-A) superfamily protein (DUF2064 family)
MPPKKKKKNKKVIAVCIQEPLEDGSSMDLGAIRGDDLKFLHQAFITDTISNALAVTDADVRLYFIDMPERKRFVKIVTEYLATRLKGKWADEYKRRFTQVEQAHERCGIRLQEVFDDCFKSGYECVLTVGSRTPTITPYMFNTAIGALDKCDAVFGPTPEGRYYMIGMSDQPKLKLSDFDWKSSSIYNDVARAFDSEDLSWSELEIWYVIESEEELELMVRDINQYRFEGDESTARETELVMERLLNKLEM